MGLAQLRQPAHESSRVAGGAAGERQPRNAIRLHRLAYFVERVERIVAFLQNVEILHLVGDVPFVFRFSRRRVAERDRLDVAYDDVVPEQSLVDLLPGPVPVDVDRVGRIPVDQPAVAVRIVLEHRAAMTADDDDDAASPGRLRRAGNRGDDAVPGERRDREDPVDADGPVDRGKLVLDVGVQAGELPGPVQLDRRG